MHFLKYKQVKHASQQPASIAQQIKQLREFKLLELLKNTQTAQFAQTILTSNNSQSSQSSASNSSSIISLAIPTRVSFILYQQQREEEHVPLVNPLLPSKAERFSFYYRSRYQCCLFRCAEDTRILSKFAST